MGAYVLNTNNVAFQTRNAFDRVQKRMTDSVRKLASGTRIDLARDDASGSALVTKLSQQIRGHQQSSANMQDTITLLRVAEGGLSLINESLLRLRELSLRAATDTATDNDRKLMQIEVNEILHGISREADQIDYNKVKLFNGRFNGEEGANHAMNSNHINSGSVRPNYYFVDSADPTATAPSFGGEIEFTVAQYDATATDDLDSVTATTATAGNNQAMRFQFQPNDLDLTKLSSMTFEVNGGTSANGATPDNLVMQLYDFTAGAWVTIGGNSTGTITDQTSVSATVNTNMDRFVDASGDIWGQAFVATDAAGGGSSQLSVDYVELKVSTRGESLFFQFGDDKGENFAVTLPDVSVGALGIAGLSVIGRTNAENSLDLLTAASRRVVGGLMRIGAFEQRAKASDNAAHIMILNESNMRSKLEDLNYAQELMVFSADQVIAQSAQSALAQANLAPQGILQLLA